MRPRYTWLSIACTVFTICAFVPVLPAQMDQRFSTGVARDSSDAVISGGTVSNQACEARVNDTSERLLECMQRQALWNRLSHFQKIADENPGPDGHGNRDTGTTGYIASLNYIATLMRRAGYRVTVQPYHYTVSEIIGVPQFATPDESYASRDWFVARLSGGGTLTGSIQPSSSSGSGCFPEEFAGFVRGNIALLQRGTCTFDTQVENAERAGASAVILYNKQRAMQDEDGIAANHGSNSHGAFRARLKRPAAIPVIGVVSFAVGSGLYQRYTAGTAPAVHLDIRTRRKSGTDYNLIAESRSGDPNQVVVVDAHLDSIFGAGILDNASGSTTALEIALKLAKTPTRNQLRYIWFGGEEIGLLGSSYYTQHLSRAERRRIAFDLDVDVTATPNFDYLVADPAFASNVKNFPKNVVPESKIGNQFFADFFSSNKVPSLSASFGNDGTDSNSFSLVGIPNTGILTQQDCCKEAWEVKIWGGVRGNYEGKIPSFNGGCVDNPNRWCDNLSNNDPAVLELASKATAYVTLKLANHPFAVPR